MTFKRKMKIYFWESVHFQRYLRDDTHKTNSFLYIIKVFPHYIKSHNYKRHRKKATTNYSTINLLNCLISTKDYIRFLKKLAFFARMKKTKNINPLNEGIGHLPRILNNPFLRFDIRNRKKIS